MAANGKCATAVPAARLIGDPVDVVTGAVIGVDREFQLPGPFELLWRRYYDSRRHREDAGCGLGFRFEYDRRLIMDLDGLRYLAPEGGEARVPPLDRDGQEWLGQGLRVRRLSELRYHLRGADGVTMEFAFADPAKPAKVARMFTAEHAVSFGYNERGQLMLVADGMSRALKVSWNSRGQMSRVQLTAPAHDLHEGVIVEYEYDDAGRLTRTTDPYGHHLAYAYDKSGRLTRFTDRNGYSFHYRYDEHGRCVHTRGDDGVEEVELSYDPDARMTTALRGNGGTWQYFHNDALSLTQVIDPYGGVTEYQYDDSGKLVREVRPDKSVLEHVVDEIGVTRAVALPSGKSVESAEDSERLVALQRRYRVHRLPNPAHGTHVARPSAVLDWELGRAFARTRPFAPPIESTRPEFVGPDEWQSLVRAERAGSDAVGEVRDAFGLLVREVDAAGRSRRYHYDGNGNRARVTDFDGAHTRYAYESWNELVRAVDPLGHGSELRYDKDENLTRLADPGGTVSEYGYDLTRGLTSVSRNGVLRERFENDPLGRPLRRVAPDGEIELQLSYDASGLLTERKLATGDAQQFERVGLGRLARCSCDAGAIELAPSFEDARTCDLRDGRGVRYRRLDRRTELVTVLDRFELRYYRFDDDSTQMVIAPGDVVHRIRSCGSGVFRHELHGGARETAQYDANGRLLVRLRANPSGHRHDTLFAYSGEGDLQQVADSERGITRFGYDAAHRLIAVQTRDGSSEEYEYDAAGNLLHMPGLNYFGLSPDEEPEPADPSVLRPSTHGVWLRHANQLYRAHGDSFVYDRRGRMVERRGTRGSVSYRYDALDQLIAIDEYGVAVELRYDALGRRTHKRVGDRVTEFFWFGDRLAAELLPQGTLRIYLYADATRALVPFSFVEYASADAAPDSGKHFYLSCNHLGAPELVVDAAGAPVWQATIDPFGLAHVELGEDFHQPLRFPGHYHDAETGLHYNRYRYYAPALGRYLQPDPIDVEGGHNLYAYAQDGNPLRDVDLLGLACQVAERLLRKALEDEIIGPDGTPGKPIHAMTDDEKQLFCAARAAQLANEMGEGTRQEASTTVNVAIVKRANGEHEIVVTASTDNGNPPPAVRDGMHGEGTDNGPRETSEPNFPKIKNKHEGETNPDADAARAEKGNRDGHVIAVDEDGTATNVHKRSRDDEDGFSEHHAEQRTVNNLNEGDTVEAMAPSKKCCDGCQGAMAESGHDQKIPQDLGGKGAKLLDD